MDLQGKKIVITGASSGIGKALTKRMLKAGAQVVGVGRNTEAITQAFGQRVQAIKCDVSRPEEVDAMLEQAIGILGGIDIFFANAGFAYYGTIGGADWQYDEKIFRTNVISPIYTLQKLVGYSNGAPLTYVITCSAIGKMVLPGFALYCATKFAVDAFVRAYRMEKPQNVRIIPVYPVATYTSFFKRAGGSDTPMPWPRQPASWVALTMEMGVRMEARSVYPSPIFIARCIINRVLPADFCVQAIERIRFAAWRRRHQQ